MPNKIKLAVRGEKDPRVPTNGAITVVDLSLRIFFKTTNFDHFDRRNTIDFALSKAAQLGTSPSPAVSAHSQVQRPLSVVHPLL